MPPEPPPFLVLEALALSVCNIAFSLVRNYKMCCCPAVADAKCQPAGKHGGRCWSCLAMIL